MTENAQMAELAKYRAYMYRFLSRIYILEVDEALLSDMKSFVFPKNVSDADLRDGYSLFKKCVEKYTASDIVDLEVDYARIFLAAGVAQGLAAFPYESVYTSKKHLTNQQASSDVHILYAAKGLRAREDMYRIPDDHVGLEFEYMARLIEETMKAVEDGDFELHDKLVGEQVEFISAHLSRWVPLLAGDVAKYAKTDFYRAIAKITRGFIAQERNFR